MKPLKRPIELLPLNGATQRMLNQGDAAGSKIIILKI